jgi:hypothetical protein
MNTYVDDLFLEANQSQVKDDVIAGLAKAFAITNLGLLTYSLGIEVTRNTDTGSILLTQHKLALALLGGHAHARCEP